jgi:hypothetical protein
MTLYIGMMVIGGVLILAAAIWSSPQGVDKQQAGGSPTPVMPIPVPGPSCVAWLYVQHGPDNQGATIHLRSLRIIIGRHANSDIQLQGENVPEVACTIDFTPDDPHAILTSETGAQIQVNGTVVPLQQRLHARDTITIGSYSLVYFDSVWRD